MSWSLKFKVNKKSAAVCLNFHLQEHDEVPEGDEEQSNSPKERRLLSNWTI